MWLRASEANSGRKAAASTLDDLNDTVLLDRFFDHHDGAAFGALVRRYGAKVRGVCHRWLGHGQDADDAFQATFVVLVRRAGDARRIEDLGSWLCGVARRVAARSKIQLERRNVRETAAVDVRDLAGPPHPEFDDAPPLLRAEVDRLPERFRRPIQLFYWEGLTSEEAAARLGCPTGTLKWRLTRGREILRSRLSCLGIALAALLLWHPITTQASTSVQTGLAQPIDAAGSGVDADEVPVELVQGTVNLAAIVRDKLSDFTREDAPLLGARGNRARVFWTFWFVPLVLAAALALAALPARFAPASPPVSRLVQVVNAVRWARTVTYDNPFVPPPPPRACHY